MYLLLLLLQPIQGLFMMRRKDLTEEKPMQVISMWPDRTVGAIYTDATQAINTITSKQQQYCMWKRSNNYNNETKCCLMWVKNYFVSLPEPLQDFVISSSRRRLLADTYGDGTGEVANPIVCLELGQLILFRIWLDKSDRSLSHYPKYIKVRSLYVCSSLLYQQFICMLHVLFDHSWFSGPSVQHQPNLWLWRFHPIRILHLRDERNLHFLCCQFPCTRDVRLCWCPGLQ